MSHPKRYTLNPVLVWLPGADIVGIDNIREVPHASMECTEYEGGKWVLHSDYAALAAEVEHLKTRPTLANQYAEYAALAAENERLRKAGDDLAVAWARVRTDYHTWDVAVKAWDAAKEGRDAK